MHDLFPDLIDLFEHEFGKIETGTRIAADSGVQIVLFSPDGDGNRVMSTLGLHRHELFTAQGRAPLSIEIIIEMTESCEVSHLGGLLGTVALEIVSGRISAPSRGSYIPISYLAWSGQGFAAVYFTNPILRSGAFLDKTAEMSLVVVWMIPITQSELDILEGKGWMDLEAYWDDREKISSRTIQGR